ncbi:MAG: hypothetical protein JNL13_10105 [Chitinophagaceae bacterium]|nr:hypothetical protein [Chitinophagaceae bacterium]
MSFLKDLTKENLKQFGIQGLGFTMPATTQKLVDSSSSSVTFNAGELTLSSSNNWLAPFSGVLNKVNSTDKKIRFSLQKANGDMVNETGALLRLFPQQILRLKRLLAVKFEETGTHNPERANGIPKRQVPAFIFIEDSAADSITEGIAAAGTDLGLAGKLSFYDEQGYIIHPMYAVSLIKSLLAIYPALNIDSALSDHLNAITGLETTNTNTVRLVQADGKPYEGEHMEGLTAIDTNIGLYSVNTYSGTDLSLKGEIKKETTGSSFTAAQSKQLVLGNVCYGRMGDQVPLLKFPTALSNAPLHDFHTIKVTALDKYLKGTAADAFNGSKLEPKPALRMHEQLSVLTSGNAVMGRLSDLFKDSPAEALCAAAAIDTKLVLPQDSSKIVWPDFPALPAPGTVPEENNSFPTGLKEQLRTNSRADFLPPVSGTPTDVLLKLSGLPFGSSVRVFHRVFGNDATLKRGDGAGATCTTEATPVTGRTLNGELSLVLKDPLGLKRPEGTATVPTNPQLIIDIMIVLHNRKKRLFGAVTLPIQSSPGTAPTAPDNLLAGVSKKSISKAGILGLGNNTASFSFATFNATLNAALSLADDTAPRQAPRLPTMARRDLLAAARKSGKWLSLLSGGQINGNLHNAEQDLGCPGSPGGKETANTGLYTQDAQLAYDLARAAFRRTNNIYDRMADPALPATAWEEPAANTALSETEQSTDSKGTFAGAVLQNIAPYCETPELALIKEAVEGDISDIPADFDALATKLANWINSMDTTLLPTPLDEAANRLKTELRPRLNTLKADTSLSATTKERLYHELKRELSTACFGRRDSQWALQQAIKQARHSIYIETPGFSFTKGSDDADYALDLIAELTTQLSAKPGLRVILCVPRQPDYTYDQWLASEVKERFEIIENLPTDQVVAFHPIGFPGRASNLEQSTIIVDDQWALCGSSAFRRRGFCFDGSTDLVLTDLETKNGAATSLLEWRRQLLAQRLGIAAAEKSSRALLSEDFTAAFAMIRQMLIAGGLGKIERLWNGHTEGVTYAEPTISKELANPDGITFNLMEASVFEAFEELAK